MNDQQFLLWIHERLQNVHHEHFCTDFMHRLRGIVLSQEPSQTTSTPMVNEKEWAEFGDRITTRRTSS